MLMIIVKAIGAIYLVGGLVALVIMVIQNHTVMANEPEEDRYKFGEYVLGFVASWFTVAVITGYYEEKE